MLSPSEKAQLDRIEQKLDRLLSMLAPALPSDDVMQAMAFASGGIEGLKAYQKAKVEQARMQSTRDSDLFLCSDLEALKKAQHQKLMDDRRSSLRYL
jgi:actin-like ATPase involved in cell morphogenesis